MRTNKIIFNPEDNTFTTGKKLFKDLPKSEQDRIVDRFRNFLIKNTKLSDYEEDCMWMSYRYCIGRHTIASHMHANDIWKNCKGRMSKERELFTAYDINREIEDKMRFNSNGPEWHFPCTSLNKIYTTAIDIFCEFLEDYNIKSKEDYLKYYSIDVILSDNERGYKIETTTWDEKLTSMIPVFAEIYGGDDDGEYSIESIKEFIKNAKKNSTDDLDSRIRWIVRCYPNPEFFYFHDIEDLFVWNDLVHCFDYEHHHKSILIDGSECEWFWSWTRKSEESKDEPGKYYYTFGYEKIRVPVDKWNGSITTWIPDESIKENIY